ncbi:MAG: TVP38/TMEM64 family protein [Stenotrophobium sp.]
MTEPAPKSALRRWLPALALMAVLLAIALFAWARGYTVPAFLRWAYETTHDAPWLLLLLFAVRPPFILPVSLPVFLCGALWGLWPGGLYAVIGMLLSAVSSYATARYVLPPSATARPEAAGLMSKWIARLRRDSFLTVMIMRLMLLPFDPVNFAAAGLRVNFRTFFLATVVGNTVATVVYANVGAAIHLDELLSGRANLSLGSVIDIPQLVLAAVFIAISLLVARVIRKRQDAG